MAKRTTKRTGQTKIPGTNPRPIPKRPAGQRKIKELEDLAVEYVKFRDARQKMGLREQDLKKRTLAALKKHKLRRYHVGRVEMDRTVEKEKLNVRILSSDDDE